MECFFSPPVRVCVQVYLTTMGWGGANLYSTLKSVVSRYLERSFSELSPVEADFMSDVATQDLTNYIAVRYDLLYEPDFPSRATDFALKLAEEKPLEFDSIVSEWLDFWVIKWKQRVKLVMGEDAETTEAIKRSEEVVGPLINALGEEVEYYRRFTVGSLVRLGEVCFTNLMADMVTKEVLYKIALGQRTEDAARFIKSNPAFVLSEIVKRTREVSRFKGSLVVVRVNPAFFQGVIGDTVEW